MALIRNIAGISIAMPNTYQRLYETPLSGMKMRFKTLSKITGIPKPLEAPNKSPAKSAPIKYHIFGFT